MGKGPDLSVVVRYKALRSFKSVKIQTRYGLGVNEMNEYVNSEGSQNEMRTEGAKSEEQVKSGIGAECCLGGLADHHPLAISAKC